MQFRTFRNLSLVIVGFISALLMLLNTTAYAGTPDDVLIVGQVAEPKSLDPQAVTAVNDFRILMNIYDGLVRYKDGTLEIEPALATSWKISKPTVTAPHAALISMQLTDEVPANGYLLEHAAVMLGTQRACLVHKISFIWC